MLSQVLNIIGLLCDIAGVAGLYSIRVRNLNEVQPKFYSRPPLSSKAESGIAATVGSLIYELNKNIEETNKRSRRNDKRAIKYFVMILIGCAFQISSSVLSSCHAPSDKPCTKQQSAIGDK